MFAGATAELLAAGLLPSAPPAPAAFALQRLRITSGGNVVTPADDPRLILLYVESGTLTVRNTVAVTVSRRMQDQEAIPAEADFTMSPGDSYVSPAMSGGELRNEGTEDVTVLASLIVPIPAGTPTP